MGHPPKQGGTQSSLTCSGAEIMGIGISYHNTLISIGSMKNNYFLVIFLGENGKLAHTIYKPREFFPEDWQKLPILPTYYNM